MTMKSAQGNKKLHMKKIHLFHFMRPCITKVNTLTFNKVYLYIYFINYIKLY